jgi:hypothetical protein
MPSPYRPIGIHPRHAENPFIEQAIKDIRIVKRSKSTQATNKAMQVIVNSDGEVTGHSQFLQYIEVDEEKFAKLYLSQFAAFWELNKPAIRVFGYIISIIKPGQDRFVVKMDQARKHTKYNQEVSIISGLSQLIECEIIARSEYDWEYFINPMVVFNGDRVTYAKTYLKKKKDNPNQIKLFPDDGFPTIEEVLSSPMRQFSPKEMETIREIMLLVEKEKRL